MSTSKIAICMATYNGEKYLCEQIDSILNQSYTNWVLFIRDDSSTDNTTTIIKDYITKYPDKIKLVPYAATDLGFGKGAAYNFMACLKYASSFSEFSYFMFSDQDDVWLPNKIKMTLGCAKKVEKKCPGPVLVYTDLMVVDSSLNILNKSYYKYCRFKPNYRDLNHLLIQNHILGCTMLFNKKLADYIIFNSIGIFMHDWWIALISSCFGSTVCLRHPTIKYRQHSSNTVGAIEVDFFSLEFYRNKLKNYSKLKKELKQYYLQANSLLHAYHDSLSHKQINIITSFSHIQNENKFCRVFHIFLNRHLFHGMIRIIGEVLRI